MDCPNCRLVNPATALQCDCGYDFKSRNLLEVKLRSSNAPAVNGASIRLLVRIAVIVLIVLAGALKGLSRKETAVTDLLRETAFQRFKARGKEDRITDPAVGFIERFHGGCVDEAYSENKEAGFEIARTRYMACMEKAFRERP